MRFVIPLIALLCVMLAGCQTRSPDSYLDIVRTRTHTIYVYTYVGSRKVEARYYRLDTGELERVERVDR
jgi:hypothetical protein